MNLLKKSLSVLAVAAMAVSLAGCGGSSSSSKSTESGEKVFRFGQSNPKVGLDMQTNTTSGASSVADNVLEGLYRWNDDNKEECVLAKDMPEVSDDGLGRTYKLRKDAKWDNGDPVTAHDFVYAWYRIFKNKGNYYYMFADGIASIQGAQELSDKIDVGEELTDDDLNSMGVKALDGYTLEVKTTVRVSFLDELLAFPPFYPINEKFAEKQGSKYGKSAKTILGNGAFKMINLEPGSVAEFKKMKTIMIKNM